MPTDSARLFLALWPGPAVRGALVDARDAWAWPAGARPEAEARLHVTLHFLGAVERERVPALDAALRGVPCAPFELRLARAALWPHGIAVLQPRAVPPRLLELHAALGALLRRLELPVETRPYRPHVTLARHAVGAAPPGDTPALHWRVRGHALVESLGGAYVVLGRYGC
jgi:2'-5' RNA ligase